MARIPQKIKEENVISRHFGRHWWYDGSGIGRKRERAVGDPPGDLLSLLIIPEKLDFFNFVDDDMMFIIKIQLNQIDRCFSSGRHDSFINTKELIIYSR